MAAVPRPKGGYNGKSKCSWRVTINELFKDYLGDLSTKSLALFPQSNVEEIVEAMRAGFKPENIYAIDKSPQVLSNLTMKLDKLKMPRVHSVGTMLSYGTNRDLKTNYSGKQIPLDKIDAANLDFNGWISHDFSGEVWRFATSGVLRDPAIVAVTFFEGREQRETRDLIERLGVQRDHDALGNVSSELCVGDSILEPMTRGRLLYIRGLLQGHTIGGRYKNRVEILDTGWYLSTEHTRFRWAVFFVERLP